jgi:LPS-assembly lipoprotein
MIRARTLAALLLASATLSGCALQPLYAGGGQGAVAQTLSSVDVGPIEGEAGWLVRSALTDRLRANGQGLSNGAPRYRVNVALDDSITGYGVRADDSVTRERRTLRARWQLVEAATGATLVDASATSDAGIDVVGSEFATIAAERTALEQLSRALADQIATRIALFARRQQASGAN